MSPERGAPGDRSSARPLEAVALAVAHDLNNVFAVIVNYSEFVLLELDRLHADSADRRLLSLRKDLTEVRTAAERGKHLVKRLDTAVPRLDG